MNYTNETLQRDLANGNLCQSYLLFSPDILHLNRIAKAFAKNFNVADVFWLTAKEGAKSITVDQTLLFNEKVFYSAVGDKKLLIVSDLSNMMVQAQNKMLKSLEDTRNDLVFLLLASNPEKVINTIKSRCVILYQPDLAEGSLLEQELLDSNRNSPKIFEAAKALYQCKTLDEALPHIAVLGAKDNFAVSLLALTKHASMLDLRRQRTYDIMRILSEINRNVDANCNPTNALDLLVIELFKGDS